MPEKTSNSSKWLRWAAVIPGGLIAGFLATFPLHWILYLKASGNWAILGFIELPAASWASIEEAVYPFVIAIVYVMVGAWIAPTHKTRTAVVLAVLYVIFAVAVVLWGISSGLQVSVGARIIGPIVGLLLGTYLVWQKYKQDPEASSAAEELS